MSCAMASASSHKVKEMLQYHITSSHASNGEFARGGRPNWTDQPNRFLRFEGTDMIDLDVIPEDCPVRPPATAISLESLAQFLQDACGLTAWRQSGDSKWALRTNPSGGALQPLEVYVLLGPLSEDLARCLRARLPGKGEVPTIGQRLLLHYHAYWHALQVRGAQGTLAPVDMDPPEPVASFYVIVTSIVYRNSWKYGDPGFRYVCI